MSRHKTKKIVKKQAFRWQLVAALAGVLLITGALLLAGKGDAAEFAAKVKGQPAIEVDQKEVDYGDVKLGSMIKTSIRVTNVGDQPLRFSSRPYVELIDGC